MKSVYRKSGSMVEMRVQDEGRDELIYQFDNLTEAAEMMHFLRDFFPDAQFLVQPIRQ